ncbi:MAG: hypothetical protein MUC99_12745 [Anaerolineae bacterium]|nr:hypothetical protein [Anaerolineae bacterium]
MTNWRIMASMPNGGHLGSVDGQIMYGTQPVRAEDVRFYVLYPDARLVPQATLDFIGAVDAQGQSIPIYTG